MFLLNRSQNVWFAVVLMTALGISGQWPNAAWSMNPQRVSLAGVWQMQETQGTWDLDPRAWKEVELPSRRLRIETSQAALTKTLPVPAGRDDQDRVYLVFQGLSFAAEIYVNAHLVRRTGPAEFACRVDITRFLNPARNELLLLVQDWKSCVEPGPWIENQDPAADPDNSKAGVRGVLEEY